MVFFLGPSKGPRKAEKGWTVITSSLTTAILKGWESAKRWKFRKCGIIEPCQVCKEALEDVFAWLAEGGEVAVFDATNTTRLALLICGLLPQGLGRPGYLKISFSIRRQSIQSRGWPQFSNRERRELLHSKVVTEMGYKLFFVESICEDEATIEANIRFVCLLSRKAKARQS